ncbi:MAG TPA: hypothetical protein DHU93_16330 [Algoriphagus sp.]|nr:hypothetical protein [Algoriphagus sp.]|tara:strand:+ start:442 stop:792 length:351 start_codon:yes stop_codon:yes gene_type:complete
MNLIISSSLTSDPPSEGLYFRHLTMMARQELQYEAVCIEASKFDTDFFYPYLKKKGWLDYVDDFILPEWNESGIRIDTELNSPLTIKTRYIRYENTLNLLGQLKEMRVINEKVNAI